MEEPRYGGLTLNQWRAEYDLPPLPVSMEDDMALAGKARGYSEELAEAVRRDHAAGASYSTLEIKYGCGRHVIADMVLRRRAYAEEQDDGETERSG